MASTTNLNSWLAGFLNHQTVLPQHDARRARIPAVSTEMEKGSCPETGLWLAGRKFRPLESVLESGWSFVTHGVMSYNVIREFF